MEDTNTTQSMLAILSIEQQLCFQSSLWKGKMGKKLGCKEFEDQEQALGWMMQMLKNLWNAGKVMTMESGSSVSKGTLAIWEKGMFRQALWSQEVQDGLIWFLVSVLTNFQWQADLSLQNSWAFCKWGQIFDSLSGGGKLHDKNHVLYWSNTWVDYHESFHNVTNEDGLRSWI